MIVVEILLGIATAWAFAGHICAANDSRAAKKAWADDSDARQTMGLTLIAFILALGFLGVMLK